MNVSSASSASGSASKGSRRSEISSAASSGVATKLERSTSCGESSAQKQFPSAKECETSAAESSTKRQQMQQIRTIAKDVEDELDPSELAFQEYLGAGAQAEVYKAVWWKTYHTTSSAITVAVKKLKNNSEQKAYSSEVITYAIKHPNLVKCFACTTKPPFLIVSEYCDGGSLFQLLHDSAAPLNWCQKLKILLDVARGMDYLHSLVPAVLHRDLKSCNVLLAKKVTTENQTPTAKVSDFGLCRELANHDSVAMTMCVGTWRWMAPEVFSGTRYDERVDVFSFAMVMFEVLAREIPYADTFPVSSSVDPRIGLHIMKGSRPNVSLVPSGCPGEVVQLMQACWAGDPQERPSFSMVRQKLQELLKLVAV